MPITPFKNKEQMDIKYDNIQKESPQSNKQAALKYEEIIKQTRIRLGLDKSNVQTEIR